jgi:hypothetical protein
MLSAHMTIVFVFNCQCLSLSLLSPDQDGRGWTKMDDANRRLGWTTRMDDEDGRRGWTMWMDDADGRCGWRKMDDADGRGWTRIEEQPGPPLPRTP